MGSICVRDLEVFSSEKKKLDFTSFIQAAKFSHHLPILHMYILSLAVSRPYTGVPSTEPS